jgi:hypothetical protein
MLVQSADRGALQRFLPIWREAIEALPGRRVRWALDVDPAGFMTITTRYNHLLLSTPRRASHRGSLVNQRDRLKAELEAWIAAGVAAVAPGYAGNAVVLERPKQPGMAITSNAAAARKGAKAIA